MAEYRLMNVAILTRASIWGGAEAHTMGLSSALMSQGHSVTIYCLDGPTYDLYASVVRGNVPLDRLACVKPVSERGFLDWFRSLCRIPADVCVFEKGTLHAGGVALDLAARCRFRRFVTIEQLEPMPLPPRTSRRYLGGCLPGLGLWWYRLRLRGYVRSLAPHQIVTVSDSVQHILRRDYLFPPRKMLTIWNGADPERYCPDPVQRLKTRQRWEISPDTLVFGSLRRFVRDKGLDLAIEAFRRFSTQHPEHKAALVLVGDGPERMALEKQAAASGVGERIHFPGFTQEPWAVHPALDVFVMPSRTEALSLALCEAMACGCLPIASNIGGSAEVIASPVLGWVVPPEDPQALAVAMEEAAVLGEAALAAMRSRVREHVVRHFNAPSQFAKIIALLGSEATPRQGKPSTQESLRYAH